MARVSINLTPITQLYWIRVGLGITAGIISGGFALFLSQTDLTTLINGFTIALIIYLASYYVFRAIYKNKIEKQSKILSTAIVMYFFSWFPFFVLFYTIFKVY